jgi:hypothetical protein
MANAGGTPSLTHCETRLQNGSVFLSPEHPLPRGMDQVNDRRLLLSPKMLAAQCVLARDNGRTTIAEPKRLHQVQRPSGERMKSVGQ